MAEISVHLYQSLQNKVNRVVLCYPEGVYFCSYNKVSNMDIQRVPRGQGLKCND